MGSRNGIERWKEGEGLERENLVMEREMEGEKKTREK